MTSLPSLTTKLELLHELRSSLPMLLTLLPPTLIKSLWTPPKTSWLNSLLPGVDTARAWHLNMKNLQTLLLVKTESSLLKLMLTLTEILDLDLESVDSPPSNFSANLERTLLLITKLAEIFLLSSLTSTKTLELDD
jgi:hypothetical protein